MSVYWIMKAGLPLFACGSRHEAEFGVILLKEVKPEIDYYFELRARDGGVLE